MSSVVGRRILLVIHDIGAKGGMEVQAIHLAKGLSAIGARVTVASVLSPAGRDDDFHLTDAGVRVVHLGAAARLRRIASVRRLARLARSSDLVHCTDFDASLWGRLAAIVARRPSVVSSHSFVRELQRSNRGAPRGAAIALHNRVLDPFTARTIACADCQIPLLLSEGVAADKLVHIPNGVPVDELRKQAAKGLTRQRLGIPSSARVIAHVGRVLPSKGQMLTLETVARLRGELGDVHVVFAGSGPALDHVRGRAAELDAEWAHFLGYEPNVAAVFALADLAVLPSRAEAMPMVILEAIAMGIPVVATAVGDVQLMLDSTGAGIAVPVDDSDRYFDACRTVLGSPEVAERLRANGRSAERDIDAGTMVQRYAALFAETLTASG